MKFRGPHPSAALVVALVALVVAMSGTAVAVVAAQGGDQLISKRSLSGNRLRLNTVTGKEINESKLGIVPKARKLPALAWHNLALINGWANYNAPNRPPAWAVDAQGIVHFRGAVYQGGADLSMDFATLPAAVRPSAILWLSTNAIDGNYARVDLYTTGALYAECPANASLARAFTNLDGITYALG
ncbi:MAG TPA: hypothetical protein VLI04_12290 [Nocardioidaceae bacterium]|nr:hypothetical protein [Nocardioidaceae bacterium]